MMLPRFLKFEKYETRDVKEFLKDGRIELFLTRDMSAVFECHRCYRRLSEVKRGDYFMRIEAMPIMGYRTFLNFRRYKFHCDYCNKARSERVEFLSEVTPHLSADLSWWIGRLCEIASVTRVAELVGHDGMTTWRLDYHRMIQMLQDYRLPKVRRLSIDEVYGRKTSRYPNEPKDHRYLTVITDLETRKVIWVVEGRSKEALDGFFKILGPEACAEIEVVATDQHAPFAASIADYCRNATVVWDKFHLLQNFEAAVNETRQEIFNETPTGHPLKLMLRGKYKYWFLKRASLRTTQEARHIERVVKDNEVLHRLELIKERMLTFFDEPDEQSALFVWTEIGDWIKQCRFKHLEKWHQGLTAKWSQLANYFKYRVTTSVSEGINNIIKTLKRKAYGYRNMNYFRLKIMQVCGYLNSKYIKSWNQLHTQI